MSMSKGDFSLPCESSDAANWPNVCMMIIFAVLSTFATSVLAAEWSIAPDNRFAVAGTIVFGFATIVLIVYSAAAAVIIEVRKAVRPRGW